MSDRPMTTIVEFQIRPESNSMDEWLAEWDLRARDAYEGEPETSAYAAAVNLENELNVLVYERYDHGQKSLDIHTARPAHAALMAAFGERNMTKRLVMVTQFEDIPDYGWWARPDRADASTATGNILVVLGMRFATTQMRDDFVGLSSQHAQYCWNEEPDTLVYSAGLAMADAERDLDVKAGDVIFVMGCTDIAAMEKHRDDPNHLALGAKFAEQGIEMEVPFTFSYRTAGNGFLWRD